jgi:hypothetical protein
MSLKEQCERLFNILKSPYVSNILSQNTFDEQRHERINYVQNIITTGIDEYYYNIQNNNNNTNKDNNLHKATTIDDIMEFIIDGTHV